MPWSEETAESEPQRPTHNANGELIPWEMFEERDRQAMRSPGCKAWKVDCRCEAWPHWQPDPGKPNIWYVHWHHESDCPAMKRVMAFQN